MNSHPATKKNHLVLVVLTDPKRRGHVDDQNLENDIRILDSKSVLLRMQNSSAKPGNQVDLPRLRS